MSAETLLARLQGVRRSGEGWRANCPNPVHSHAKGSLSISASSDGVVLLHCFACGDVAGILAAVGLELGDLYPERIRDSSPETRKRAREAFKRSSWIAALCVLSREATVVQIAANDLATDQVLCEADRARLSVACERIEDARAVLT